MLAASDSRSSFSHALEERGYRLARGDKGGHVAISWQGQVLPITRATKKRVAVVAAKLGDPNDLPSVEDTKQRIKADLGQTFSRMAGEVCATRRAAKGTLKSQIEQMVRLHQTERAKLDQALERRWNNETKGRTDRFRLGVKGLWDRVTGRHRAIRERNEDEAYAALMRDRHQRQSLIDAQLADRRELHQQHRTLERDLLRTVQYIKSERNEFREQLDQSDRWTKQVKNRSKRPRRRRRQSPSIEM